MTITAPQKLSLPFGVELPSVVSIVITFNDHATNYETLEEWEANFQIDDRREDWVSEDERTAAIKANSLWSVQVYPNSPVSFFVVYASTLEAALKGAEAACRQDA